MFEIKTEKNNIRSIAKNKTVKVILSENYAEIISSGRETESLKYQRISSNQYLNRDTGEIKNYSNTDNRILSVDSLRKTYKKLEWVTKSNFKGGLSEIFMTLGYDSPMNDYQKLKRDFNSFRRKFDREYPKCEYIVIVEYKGKGDLHLHLLLKTSDNTKLFLDRNLIIKFWKQNAVYIERIGSAQDVDGLVSYLNPFKNKHKFGRLIFYKRNFKIYRRSQGIKTPKILKMTYNQAEEMMMNNNYKQYYSSSYNIIGQYSDGTKNVLNDVTTIQYRKSVG